MKLLEAEKNENIKQNIYRNLKYNIMSLTLKPGEKISESELQKIFNASKSPIREALAKLKEEALIDVIPQKGTFISKISTSRLDEAMFMRESLEKSVFKVAQEKLIPEDIIELKKLAKFQEGILEFGSDIKEFFYSK